MSREGLAEGEVVVDVDMSYGPQVSLSRQQSQGKLSSRDLNIGINHGFISSITNPRTLNY
jgi:hypothetical protein